MKRFSFALDIITIIIDAALIVCLIWSMIKERKERRA